jgi:7-keto-8-aminopelargonate synthetase-like enzyme
VIKELRQELEQLQALRLVRELHTTVRLEGGMAEIKGRRVIDFTSWDYLNLNFNPRLRRSVGAEVEKSGVTAGGSRLSTGTFEAHTNCERRIAAFLGTESALLFSSKNQAVLSLLTNILSERDAIFVDEMTQSPVTDAAFLVHALSGTFKSDDAASLEDEIEKQRSARRKVIFVESLSPISGKPADLNRIFLVAKKFGCEIILDESFAAGAFGLRGSGLSEDLGLREGVLCTIMDLSFGICGHGTAIAGSSVLIQYLLSRSRTFHSESAPPPAVVVAGETGIDICELQPTLRKSLLLQSARLSRGLSEIGFACDSTWQSPIISIQFAKRSIALEFATSIFSRGVLVDVVPRGRPELHSRRIYSPILCSTWNFPTDL